MASSPESTAQRTDDFVKSIGLNTHISWSGPWANWSNLNAELAYTGVTNVRDSTPYASFDLSEYQQLAAQGIKFDIITTGPDVDLSTDIANIDALETSNPGSVASIEGTNEFNVNHNYFNGEDSYGNPAWGAGLDAALQSAVAGNATLSGKTVVAASFANASTKEIQQQGSVSGQVGASNWHAYFGQGSQPASEIQSAVTNAKAIAPGRQVYITESGYYTAVNAQQWGGGGVNEDAQAKMTINLLLDAYKNGASKTFIYELMDNIDNPPSSDLEDSFGIFNGDGTPKLAATALHNLTSITADRGSTATTFAPGSLQYSLTGTNAQDNNLLLEKSDGTFDLALWNEQPIWNEATNSEMAATTHDVTVAFGQEASVKVYDVLTGSVISQNSGTSGVSVALSDRPVIVEIAPTTQGVVCFVAGTLIQTVRGDVAVEQLVAGDSVITSSGERRPIRWLGHRRLNFGHHPNPKNYWPIRITAHAFGSGLPERELRLSPGHLVLVGASENGAGGHLVPIMCLINGTTIKRIFVDEVTYWHVELDEHDILLAEGLPAESYLDLGSRSWFAGVEGTLYNPDCGLPGMPSRCRPVAIDGPVVELERRRLTMEFTKLLAGACGWPSAEGPLFAV